MHNFNALKKELTSKKPDTDYWVKIIFHQHKLNACSEELRYISTFCLIPQLEYSSSDCTGGFFSRKLSREIN